MSQFEPGKLNAGTVLGAIGAIMGLAALIVSLSSSAEALPNQTQPRPAHIVIHKGEIEPGAVTARTLAKGAVHPKALAKGAVNSRALADGAVNRRVLKPAAVIARSIAPDAVSAAAIAPGSVYGGALGTETLQTKSIADLDQGAHNIEWTPSNTEAAVCGPGEALLGSGFAFTSPGNGEVSQIQALPFLNGEAKGVTGRISSDAGGTATAEVAALCLK